jgi:hypothetical protein
MLCISDNIPAHTVEHIQRKNAHYGIIDKFSTPQLGWRLPPEKSLSQSARKEIGMIKQEFVGIV